MTNILASIVLSLVTNVMVTDNAVRDPLTREGWELMGDNMFARTRRLITPATERYTLTEVREIKAMISALDGQSFSNLVSERLVSSTTKTEKLLQEWAIVGVVTNDVTPPVRTNVLRIVHFDTVTNIILQGGPWLNDARAYTNSAYTNTPFVPRRFPMRVESGHETERPRTNAPKKKAGWFSW